MSTVSIDNFITNDDGRVKATGTNLGWFLPQYDTDQIREYAIAVCKELDFERVNTGEIWMIVCKEHSI